MFSGSDSYGWDDVVTVRAGLRWSQAGRWRMSVAQSEQLRTPDSTTDATRYLCVGAHVDQEFSRAVLRELFGDQVRVVAPSFGFDARTVALHCLAARRHRRIRDALLAGLALLMFVLSPVVTVLMGLSWWFWGWFLGALRPEAGGFRRAIERINLKSLLFAGVAAALLLWLAVLWQSITAVIGAASTASSSSQAVGSSGVAPGAGPLAGLILLVVSVPLVLLGWAVLYAIEVWDVASIRGRLTRHLRRDVFQQRPEPRIMLSQERQRRLADLAHAQGGNLTVYSRFNPFVGCGEALPAWSFSTPLVAASSGVPARPFSIIELVDHVRQEIALMATTDARAAAGSQVLEPLAGLVVRDRVFVDGLAVAGDRRFLPDNAPRPATRLTDEAVRWIACQPYGPVRHYLCTYVQSWDGELVPFVFFHFSTDGEKLYFECARSVLLPIDPRYRAVDLTPTSVSFGDVIRMLLEAAARTVPDVVGAPGRVVADLWLDLVQTQPQPRPPFDHGARTSIRELGAGHEYGNYFQKVDADKHFKIVERQAFSAIRVFLDEHGFDVAEFLDRQGSILNYGVIQTGGVSNVRNQAVGQNAKVTQNVAAQPAGSK